MKKTTIAGATMVALFTIGSCATTEPSGTAQQERRGTNATEIEQPTPKPKPKPKPDMLAEFGEGFEWQDGLYIKISEPRPFRPSRWAASGKAPHNVLMDVTLVNGTGRIFDPSGFYSTMQSGNREAEEVYDFDNQLGGGPTTKLLPGREASFQVGYNVIDPKDLVLEVAPSWDHKSVIFFTS